MIRMKIAFVLRLVDDYSGQCIRTKGFRFLIGGKIVHPIEKEEGLYVFLEPQESDTRVWIEGIDYHSCSVVIQKNLLDPEEPIAEIRLYGRSGKGISGSCALLTGVLHEKDRKYPVEVYCKRSRATGLILKECRTIEGGHWMTFQGFTKENLLGKTYLIEEEDQKLFFVLSEKRGINEYRIEPESAIPEKLKAGAPLVRIYRSVTDAHGAYAIPVECGEEHNIQEVMILQHTSPS